MLEAIREAIQNTPLLSPSTIRLLQVDTSADDSLEEIIAIVRCDAALTARVLRVVNSPVFGLVQAVESVERAISYLGSWMVVAIVIGESAGRLLQKPLDGYEGERGELWRHDLFTAFAAREISRHAHLPLSGDIAFTAGLLHDIGKPIISDFLRGSPARLLEQIGNRHAADYAAAERELVGMDHAEVGYELARCWGFSDILQTAIRYHHQPLAATEAMRPLVFAVHLGDIVAMLGGYGTGSDSMQYPLVAGYADHFALGPESLEKIFLSAQQHFEQADQAFTTSEEG